jgi:site-specific DNA-methyltransferase (adenine-specific)
LNDEALKVLAAQLYPPKVEDVEPQIDSAAELQKKWNTARGQVWKLGEHRLMCGDSTSAEDVGKLMGGETMRLFLTDAPYGVNYAQKNKYLNTVGKGNRIQTPIENDNLNTDELSSLWFAVYKHAFDVSDAGCPYYICSPQGGELMMVMMMMIQKAGWLLKPHIIWKKNNHVLGRSDYQLKHEPILYGWKPGSHWFYGGRSEMSVFEIDKPVKSEFHPTMKPVELFEKPILNSSLDGEIVGDFFCGSGTTLIACEKLNRKCRAMEIAPEYVAVALERWSMATGKTPELMADGG